MQKIFSLVLFLLGIYISWLAVAHASNDPVACTMEYAPVCGSVQVQCIRAPCDPVRQTFGNACVARAAGATNITPGECETVVGGDRDEHGCIPSAGYSWDADLGKCARPWETRSFVLTVAPNTVDCTGVSSMNCLRVRVAAARNWTNWYGNIRNFSYEAGYTYRLRVKSSPVDPLADRSDREYTVARVIQKIPLMGSSWILESFNGKTTNSTVTLSFSRNKISAKACNSMFGNYSLSGNTIKTQWFLSTKMYCSGGDLMTIEDAMDLTDAKWSIKDGKLTIITTSSNVIVWKIR